jgi:A/G-specific adenine glycosylase
LPAPPRERTGGLTPSPGATRVAELQERLLTWYAVNGRDLPWRRTTDPYAVLISEVMLQQTQVPRVVPRYAEFLHSFPTLEALAGGPLADVLRRWRGLGYNNRAERLWRCAREAVARSLASRHATLPDTLEELRGLPGIGPYTARAILVFAHNADLAAVDANVRRVLSHELGLPTDLAPAALQAVADVVLPHGCSRDWHNALMDYGSLVLTARATGIAPRTRQGAFEGSRRWYRSRLLRTLLDDGPQDVASLAGRLGTQADFVEDLCRALERDGLARHCDGLVGPA